jgi:hypothetical protein
MPAAGLARTGRAQQVVDHLFRIKETACAVPNTSASTVSRPSTLNKPAGIHAMTIVIDSHTVYDSSLTWASQKESYEHMWRMKSRDAAANSSSQCGSSGWSVYRNLRQRI